MGSEEEFWLRVAFAVFVLLLGVGYVLAISSSDHLKSGRYWLKMLIALIVGIAVGEGLYLLYCAAGY